MTSSENIEENDHFKNYKQDLIHQIQKVKDDENPQEEMIRNLKNDKDSLENKLEQIQRTSRPSDSKIQVEEKEANTNPVINTVKKEFNPVEEQTTKTPY